jgi:hypothetical protein
MQSYSSIFNLGHKAVADIFKTPVLCEEKVDGSQFSFGVYPTAEDEPGDRSWLRGMVQRRASQKAILNGGEGACRLKSK